MIIRLTHDPREETAEAFEARKAEAILARQRAHLHIEGLSPTEHSYCAARCSAGQPKWQGDLPELARGLVPNLPERSAGLPGTLFLGRARGHTDTSAPVWT
jgi:hypothetical protein